MKKQLLAMFLAMGLLASGIPHTAWAKNPEDNVKTLDSAVDVQQALHANGPEAKGTKENAQEDAQEEEDDSQAEARNLYFPFPYNGAKSMGLDKLKESRNWGTGEVKVAVIDSGINKVNEYFTNRIDERNSVNFAVDSPNQPENYGDIYGHGSHVVGIITKSTPENVKIMAIRVFDVTTTASLSTINLGIHHADEHDADIINLSLGQLKVKEEEEDFINEAMETAVKHNRTCMVAAGNEKMDAEGSFPARSGWGITIGSYEEQGKKPEKKPNLEKKIH